MRVYLSSLIGTGDASIDDAYRPALTQYWTGKWSAVDGRGDPTVVGGMMLVFEDTDSTAHAAAVADPNITFRRCKAIICSAERYYDFASKWSGPCYRHDRSGHLRRR